MAAAAMHGWSMKQQQQQQQQLPHHPRVLLSLLPPPRQLSAGRRLQPHMSASRTLPLVLRRPLRLHHALFCLRAEASDAAPSAPHSTTMTATALCAARVGVIMLGTIAMEAGAARGCRTTAAVL